MYAVSKKSSISGNFLVPGSKSQTIRAVFMALLADGKTIIHNPLASSDGLSAFSAAQALGGKIEICQNPSQTFNQNSSQNFSQNSNEIQNSKKINETKERKKGKCSEEGAAQENHYSMQTMQKNGNDWIVTGLGGKIKAPSKVIDTGNSGTTTSFVTGLCTLIDGFAVITGDQQICSRPVRSAVNAFNELGANCFITRPDSDCPPIVVGGKMHGGVCHLPGINSQHVSAILVPGALIPEGQKIEIEVENPKETSYIQMTIDWMKKFGVSAVASPDFKHYSVAGGQKYRAPVSQKNSAFASEATAGCAGEVTVSSDWSGVAFPLVAAVCTQSEITITGLNFSDPQADKQIVDILIKMGADIEKNTEQGFVKVHGGKPLTNDIQIDMNDIPDALPALCVAACYSKGKTEFTTLSHIRQKESDRVAVMAEELTKCGSEVKIENDKMTILGGKTLHGAEIDSRGDHRVAMAMAVCGMFAEGEMKISEAECADVSFPKFYEMFVSHGANFRLYEDSEKAQE